MKRSFDMRDCVPGLLACVAGLCCAARLPAAPPTVSGLFPAGVQSGQSASVTLLGKPGDAAPQVWSSRSDLTITAGEKPNLVTIAAAAEAPAGIAWLRFYNGEGASDLRPFQVGSLPEIVEVEPNNALAEAQRVESLPALVNGTLHKGGENDTFLVTLEAGQTLIASMEARRVLGSPMDGLLQVVSQGGFVLAQNDDDRGFDPQLTFTAPAAGEYGVRTFAFPAEPNSTIGFAGGETYIYRLALTTGPVIDHVVPLAVHGAALAPLQLIAAPIAVEPATATPLVSDGQATLPTSVHSTFLAHRLPIVASPPVVEPAAADPPALLELPVCLTGHVSTPGEKDVFRLAGKKGQKLRFTVDARKFDSPLDPLLRLFGPDGKAIKEQDDGDRRDLDPEFEIDLPADGEYRVEITDRFRAGGPRMVYLLSVAEAASDFDLSVESGQQTLKPGTPLEITVNVSRRNGFKEEIVFTVEGLPAEAGVTLAEMKSLPEGDTAKSVKLKLEAAGGEAFNGPFRIVGAAGSVTRTADTPLPGLTDRTHQLWLTVLAKEAEKKE